ncbi:hypothetical protein ACO0LO_23610 [Undibacterium sp. TJN25]|uniref:hypothetical protein n=1 Tax=Undibacterium sp. TJN25 TaxID=3413056 RepID=UPI003BF1DCCE
MNDDAIPVSPARTKCAWQKDMHLFIREEGLQERDKAIVGVAWCMTPVLRKWGQALAFARSGRRGWRGRLRSPACFQFGNAW